MSKYVLIQSRPDCRLADTGGQNHRVMANSTHSRTLSGPINAFLRRLRNVRATNNTSSTTSFLPVPLPRSHPLSAPVWHFCQLQFKTYRLQAAPMVHGAGGQLW